MKIINWDIVAHPVNWLTLFLMVLFAAIAVHFLLEHVQLKTNIGDAINEAADRYRRPTTQP